MVELEQASVTVMSQEKLEMRLPGAARLPQIYYAKGRYKSSIANLQASFRDPNSPFYIPPGGKGPASPDEAPDVPQCSFQPEISRVEDAHKVLLKEGLDPLSFWDQKIVWGDQDSFQHVNNARYVQFFEASRIKWLTSLGEELGGPQKAHDMIRGRGVSLILKSIEVKFRRPVTYPDTLLIGYQPTIPLSNSNENTDPTILHVAAKAYSLAQKVFVAQTNEVLVWYDYDKLKKCDPGDRIRDIVNSRIQKFLAPSQ